MKNLNLIVLVALFATIYTEATFQLFSHSGSWCDYETKLGKVNIQVRQTGISSSEMHTFNMTLLDSHGQEFDAMCTIEAIPGETDKENEDENESLENEKESADEDESITEETQENEDQVEDKTEEKEDQPENKEDKMEEKEDQDEDKEDKTEEKEDQAEEKEDQAEDKEDKAEEKEDQAEDKEDKTEEKENKAEDKEEETKEKDKQLEEKEEEEEMKVDKANDAADNGRRLQEEGEVYYPYSYCLFTPTKHDGDLTFKKDSISTKEDIEIEVTDDFHVIAQKCLSEDEAKKAANINLSFRQINGFKYENGEITFNFYGITTQDLIKTEIHFFIYLFFDGKLENELKEATCSLNEEVKLTDNKPVQVALECKISNLEKEYTSFMLSGSEEVSGIPEDNEVLLDPVKTEEAIKAGDLLDYSLESNQVVPPMFAPSSVEGSQCSQNGKFTYTGQFDSDFEGGNEVKIPLLLPAGEISCNFPSAKINQDVSIECKFIGNEMEQFIVNEQQSLKKDEKEELLIMKGISSADKIKCVNGEVSAAETKKNLTLSFRQINHFKYENQKITFDFYGLSSISLEINTKVEFIFYVFLISGGVKENSLKEAKCSLSSNAILMTGEKLVVAPFSCSITGLEKEYTSLEISYSDEIAGIPDNEILLDPVKTQEAIENEKLPDYSVNFTPSFLFTADSVDGNKCAEKGELSISGQFERTLNKDVDFEISATYPPNTVIKCTVAAKQSVINCVSSEINGASLILEQQVIRDGLNELFTLGSLESSKELYCQNGNIASPEDKTSDKAGSDKALSDKTGSDKTSSDKTGSDKTSSDKTGSDKAGSDKALSDKTSSDKTGSDKTSSDKTSSDKTGSDKTSSDKTGSDKTSSDKISSDKTSSDKTSSDKTSSDKTSSDKTSSDKTSSDKTSSDKTSSDKTSSDKTSSDKTSSDKTSSDKTSSDKTSSDKTSSDKTSSDKTSSDKTSSDKTSSDKTSSDKTSSDKTSSDKASSDKTSSDKTSSDKIPEVETPSDMSSQEGSSGDISSQEGSSGDMSSQEGISGNNTSQEGSSGDNTSQEGSSGDNTSKEGSSGDNSSKEGSSGDNSSKEGSSGDNTSKEGSSGDNSSQEGSSGDKILPSNSTEDEITLEEAKERADLTISFRQLNKFTFASGTITFMFYGLSTESYSAGTEITMLVNLIKITGETEEDTTEVKCSLESDISTSEGQSTQGDFKCTLSGLEEEYYSLRLNSSDNIAGIPDDETLLNPVLTAEAIERGELKDYSLSENKGQDKIPSTFKSQAVKEEKCKTEGKLTIEGKLSKEVKNELKFDLPLTYPEGITLSCSLSSLQAGDSSIICQVDRALGNDQVVIEQITIKDGGEEVLTIGGIASEENITCSDGLLKEAEERTNIDVAFRQISKLKDNGSNGFSFFFAGLVTKAYKAGVELKIKIVVLINGDKKEKDVTCKLRSDVSPSEGTQIQGDFDCEATVESDEYKNIDFTDPEAISISNSNPEVSGVSEQEDTQLSPLSTDKAIEETKEALEQNATLTDLAETLDYTEEENKNKLPPTFQPETLDLTNKLCTRGKFKIKGKFTSDVTEEMTFNLPLSYPTSRIKCKVDEAKANEEVEVKCKVGKAFKKVSSLVIENRLLKKKNKEMVFINKKSFKLDDESKCENYNTYKLEKSKKRQKASFSFLSLGNFNPSGRIARFNMGIMKKPAVQFTVIKISVIITIRASSNLRLLQQMEDLYLSVNCGISNQEGNVANLDCNSDELSGTPLALLLDSDDIEDISGLPEDADPSKSTYNLDLSDPNLLKTLNNLPTVTIESIDGSTCYKYGNYTITGTYEGGSLKDTSNVDIPFGSPDSSGLCQLKVNGNKVVMDCHNKEKFDVSTIMFEQSLIKDSEGNYLFNLNNYTNQKQFACDISVNSTVPSSKTDEDNNNNNTNSTVKNPDEDESTDKIKKYNKGYFKTGSNGLSGGAIAAIIICSIVVLAIVGALIGLSRKSSQAHAPIDTTIGTNSSLQNFEYNPKKNEF